MKKLLAVALACLLSACSQGLQGTYRDEMGVSAYTFQRDGSATVEVAGVSRQASYVREGDVVRIALPGDAPSLDFTLGADGSLTGPMGVRLLRTE